MPTQLKRLNAYQVSAIVERATYLIQDAIDESRDTDPNWWPTRTDVYEALQASESRFSDQHGRWSGIGNYSKYEEVVTSVLDYFSNQKGESNETTNSN
tara:strand:- start:267 stop:560 length:294 start_codon:yes stop_codon:yes gene_type:complete